MVNMKEGWATLAGGSDESSPVVVKLLRDCAIWRVHSVVVSPLVGQQIRKFLTVRADEPGLQVKTSKDESPVHN